MQAFSWVRRLLKSERGNVLAISAAAMPLILGSAALALDTIQLSLWKRQLQRAADSAALAGAYAVVQEKAASEAVTRDLQVNNDVPLLGAPSVLNGPTSGPFANDPQAVWVRLQSQQSFPFLSFFTATPVTLQAEATAASVFQGQYCMVSLEDQNQTGITFTGSTDIDLGCGVVSNSSSSSAISASGSARVRATPIGAVGGVPASSGYVQPVKLLPYSPKQADPYASLPRTPSPPSNCTRMNVVDVQPNRTQTIAPSPSTNNQYCITGGMDVKGTLNLAPGTYYVDGGLVNLGSQAVLNGTGVTLILTSSTPSVPTSFANISMNGGAIMNLSAPKSGVYEGVLFYQDPRTPFGDSRINGNSASVIEGSLYFPSRQLNFNGNTGLQTKCIQLVARRLVFSGNSRVVNECPTDGGAKAFDANFVRLVA
jgi:hypothetical protein